MNIGSPNGIRLCPHIHDRLAQIERVADAVGRVARA
jgi:hypothetical protein